MTVPEPTDPDDLGWAGLADDLPAAPRSVLQPYVEAIARDDPLPKVRPRPDKQPAETEVWLLRRACTTACLLALEVRSDLDPRSLAQLAADGLHDQRRAAFVEDIVSAIADPSTDTFDPTRIVRADPTQVINGFVDRYGHLFPGTEDTVNERLEKMAREGQRAAEGYGQVVQFDR